MKLFFSAHYLNVCKIVFALECMCMFLVMFEVKSVQFKGRRRKSVLGVCLFRFVCLLVCD